MDSGEKSTRVAMPWGHCPDVARAAMPGSFISS